MGTIDLLRRRALTCLAGKQQVADSAPIRIGIDEAPIIPMIAGLARKKSSTLRTRPSLFLTAVRGSTPRLRRHRSDRGVRGARRRRRAGRTGGGRAGPRDGAAS